jgi:RNA polymerase sigma factor (sigma-70 family)
LFLNQIENKVTISEPTLINRLQHGDQHALSYLYDHYSAALFGVIFRIVNEKNAAQEVLQDVFLKIWLRIPTYDAQKGKLFTWMLNIARNAAIDKVRSGEFSKQKKTKDITDFVRTVESYEVVSQSTDAIGLQKVLQQLPPEQQVIIEYLYFKGYTQSELAEEKNIPLGTVKTRLRMAMQTLQSLAQKI